MRHIMLVLGAFMLLTGCALHLHPYTNYLNESVGQADHDAVAKTMGAPHRAVSLAKGGDVWTCEYCQGAAAPSPNCQNINLIFDQSGKLIEWHDR